MNRLIEEKYKTLERFGVMYERESLESWLFEAACQVLEKTNSPKDERNLNGCMYLMLETTLNKLRTLPFREKGYKIIPSEDHREIIIGEVR